MAAAVCNECQSHPEHPEVSLSEKLRFREFVTAAAVCNECQSHPEHTEVSLSEKLRFWELVFKLFYLTIAFYCGLQNVLYACRCAHS